MEKTSRSPLYRYFVLGTGMLMQLCAGIIYMWSVFRAPVAAHLAWDANSAGITSSIMLAAFVGGIVGGGKLQDKFGPGPVAFGGSVLFGAGMLLSSLAASAYPWLIYLTYGVMSGAGVGVVYTCTVSVIQKWFPDKRGFATGMMVGAFGFSLVLFSAVTSRLLENTGVPTTFRILGITMLVVCAACSLFLKNPDKAAASGKSAVTDKKQYTTSEMLRTKSFYLLSISMFLMLSVFFVLNPNLKSLGGSRGLTESQALAAVMITGIANAAGRIAVSWLSDIFGRKPLMVAIVVMTAAGSVAMIWAENIFYLVTVAIIAFAFGGSASVYAAAAADMFGTKHIGLNYGCVMIGFGASALLFPIMSNAVVSDGSFSASFLITAAASVLALPLIAFLQIPKKSG